MFRLGVLETTEAEDVADPDNAEPTLRPTGTGSWTKRDIGQGAIDDGQRRSTKERTE